MSRRSSDWAGFSLLVLATILLSPWPLASDPIEKTPYGRSCLRIEGRIWPPKNDLKEIDKFEPALAKAGVQARWIQVVDDGGSPLVENPYLPCPHSAEVSAANEKLLMHWAEKIRASGMSVVSWMCLSYCHRGGQLHPDWRQVSIIPWPQGPRHAVCCFNSPYGDALIAYCNWAIDRFKLDGVWFDGAFWTPLWERPVPLTCRCAACQKKFKAETGLEIPEKVDWSNPTFRRWVAWRYRSYGAFIGRMAKAIRQAHPQAVVAINHYHRCDAPWYGGVPLDKYSADIISGSEAYTAETLDQTMRLCRAYGRPQSEVWRRFDVGPNPQTGVEHLLEHALVSYSAGGQPSFGWFDMFCGQNENAVAAAAMMTPIMDAIHPYVGGHSLPYAAVHVSQQTETFFFGPTQGRSYEKNPFFQTLSNWTEGFGRAHLPPDYVYDADFTPSLLARYKLLLMPLSMALSDTQARTAVEYVRAGGTLLLGPGAGRCDAEGLSRTENPLAKAFGFSFGEAVPPGAAMRPFGQGRVIVMSLDGAEVWSGMPLAGGDAKMEVVSTSPASGKYCLKCTDSPTTPQSHYANLEIPVSPFEAPWYLGGTLQFDLKVDRNAAVTVDVRSYCAPAGEPRLTVEPKGRVLFCGRVMGAVPSDQWIHATISYDFALEGKPSTCRAVLVLPDGKKLESPSVATPAADCGKTGRIVFSGPGRAPAAFWLDNVELVARQGEGKQHTAYREDFESGVGTLASPQQLASRIGEMLGRIAPPPIAIQAPPEIRAGLFEAQEGRVYVHLHNRIGQHGDWQQPTGPEVVLRGTLPIREARLAIGGRPLEIRRQGDGWEIFVPPIGLYQVIELKR